ncbi:tRNA selenocysteine 1-associated protein 1 isoform X1 [Pararge aegeria]|uniref:tRNA selenocysteine-associated protein 1 n=2 Tax=Pararge aegeria TaxID=116150 RepID=A0A8S4S4X9_9NEOP|nr:tRNA selenocysteine 1-associated protein 1 isoform X1 [Pararge aegeria]CAH2243017.1 jg10586 [Pararge aegeria aegeria]
MSMQCQLWMGSLEPNMTESFIMAAFHRMGQRPLAVKVMRNKFTGEPAGYAFVHFQTDEEAIDTMHKLNGKPIPGTFPVVRFRLNTASREARSNIQQEREFSVWVGDLSPDVDDYSLYRVFAGKYNSIKTAKVILDGSGYTKGYGFVRFGSEDEQRNALYAMNGYTGLGNKPLKICTAVPKPKGAVTPQNSSPATANAPTYNSGTEYNHYYDPSAYWQNYSAWSGYYGQDQNAAATQPQQQQPQLPDTAQPPPAKVQNDELALVDHKRVIDVDQMNQEFLDPELCVWDALEASQWFPQEIVEAH